MRWPVKYCHKKKQMRRLRKTKFIVLTSPRDRGHGILCRATWENTRGVWSGERRQGPGKGLGQSPYWVSLEKEDRAMETA